MAISTIGVFLMKTGTPATKLIDIKSFPDLGSAPEQLETTTMSDTKQTYIEGIETNAQLAFTANYTKADYDTIAALKGTSQNLEVWFGATRSNDALTPTGSDGKWSITGLVSVYVNGNSVNGVTEMTITVTPSAGPTRIS